MKTKRIISLATSLILLLTMLPMSAHAASDDAPNLNTASAWAPVNINMAYQAGFVQADLLDNYTAPITRMEAVKLCLNYAVYATGKTADKLLSERMLERNPTRFTDTSDPDILAAAALGITAGVTLTEFGVNHTYTREQSATLLRNTCRMLGYVVTELPTATWADMNAVHSYAYEAVNFVTIEKIMNGYAGEFSPLDTYSREMAITCFVNMMKRTEVKSNEPTYDVTTFEPSKEVKAYEHDGYVSSNAHYIDHDVSYNMMKPILENIRIYIVDGQYWMDIDYPALPNGYQWGLDVSFYLTENEETVKTKNYFVTQMQKYLLVDGVEVRVFNNLPSSGKVSIPIEGFSNIDTTTSSVEVSVRASIESTNWTERHHEQSDCIFELNSWQIIGAELSYKHLRPAVPIAYDHFKVFDFAHKVE